MAIKKNKFGETADPTEVNFHWHESPAATFASFGHHAKFDTIALNRRSEHMEITNVKNVVDIVLWSTWPLRVEVGGGVDPF